VVVGGAEEGGTLRGVFNDDIEVQGPSRFTSHVAIRPHRAKGMRRTCYFTPLPTRMSGGTMQPARRR
jgi:hypothetical protein